ncbi:MAG: hypothetical protein HZB65_02720 [Candidatus Aenigmarchaeota archaeon]|nr:hypothetical protein [Candidatus Aenigmarchaeota archaeon]
MLNLYRWTQRVHHVSYLIIYLVCYKKKRIDIDIFEREHRTLPYIVAILSFALAVASFAYLKNTLMFAFVLAYLNVAIVMFIINLKWKISAHCSGIAGIATDAVYVLGPVAYPVFILVPFIAFVRYKLNAHTIGQLVAGAAVSINNIISDICCSLSFVIFLRFCHQKF